MGNISEQIISIIIYVICLMVRWRISATNSGFWHSENVFPSVIIVAGLNAIEKYN